VDFYGTLDTAPTEEAKPGTGGDAGTGTQGVVLTIVPVSATVTPFSHVRFSAVGGVAPYTFAIASGGGTIADSDFTAPGTPGETVVQVTDAAAGVSTAVITTVALTLSISPATLTILTSGSYTFTASGGTPGYTFSSSGVGSMNGSTFKAGIVPGSATVTVTDSVGAKSTASVTVVSPLVITPGTAYVKTSTNTVFDASGGEPGYTYSLVSGVGSATATGIYTAPASVPALSAAVVRVTDTSGSHAEATVTVVAPLSLSPSPASVASGDTLTFSSSGGDGAYEWSATIGGIDAVTGVFTSGALGTGTVTVTDGHGDTASGLVTVYNAASLAIVPASVTVPPNGTVTFTAIGGSGTGYTFAVLPASGAGTINPDTGLYAAPPSAGSATVRLTDSAAHTADAAVTIDWPPVVISPSTAHLAANGSVVFSATGGTGAGYTFSVVPASGAGAIGESTGLYTAPGTGCSATVHVEDSLGNTAEAAVTVDPPPLAIDPRTANVPVNGGMSFAASGGTLPYTWSANAPSGIFSAPATAGAETVTVTDSALATASAVVTVFSPLGLAPAAATVGTGSTTLFTASGGIPPYSWEVQTGPGSIDQSGVYTAPATPASGVVIRLRDSIGNTAVSAVTVVSLETWSITAFSLGGKPGAYVSLALEADGDPQIAYYDETAKGQLKILRSDGWKTEQVDGNTAHTNQVGTAPSLVLDASGKGRVSYYDSGNKALKFASYDGAAWTRQTVDAGAGSDVGRSSSLGLEASGNARIAYSDATSGALRYVEQTGPSTWSTPVVVDAAGPGSTTFAVSLALAPGSLAPRIAFCDVASGTLKYATYDAGGWSTQAVPGATGGQYVSLALDPANGLARMSWYDAVSHRLMYVAQTATTAWDAPVVVDTAGDVGQYSSLVLDASGNPRISFYDATNGNLKCAVWTSARWDLQTVDSGGTLDVGRSSSLRIDPVSGKLKIAYYDAGTPGLRYAVQQ
jgi:hypothetical protein